MKQQLEHDEVSLVMAAPPQAVYDLIADVTRMPEFSPYITKIEWLDGATEAAVGARFKATNSMGRKAFPDWNNKPVITVVDPGREIAWERTELGAGTIEWRYRFEPHDGGTRVVESYRVVKPLTAFGWFIIGTLAGIDDDATTLRTGMAETLRRIKAVVEQRTDAALNVRGFE